MADEPAPLHASGWRDHLALLAVVAGVGLGLVVIAFHHFRIGSLLIAFSVLGAAVLRLIVPERFIGLLAIRHRTVDIVTMSALGIALVGIALSVPRP